LESKVFNLAKQRITNGEELFRLAVQLKLDDKSIKELIEQYQQFQEAFLALSSGLTKLFEKQ
jgi:hypothetical protein